MHIFFWDKNKKINIHKRLPKYIQNYIQQRFEQYETGLDDLRCIEYDEQNDEKSRKLIRIYSQSLVKKSGFSVHCCEDLDKHPEVLLYKGYVDVNGTVHMEDLRVMSY
ncbi:MAG: hypothetical protein NTV30_02360 [Chloroflexi bacterium]|nr:hypothetical protein [Chloroflexota bacterium]